MTKRKYIGGAEPEATLESVPTLDEAPISPEIQALINKGIQQQQVLLRTGANELTGGGSADPDDLEEPEDTLDIQAVLDYTDIEDKNQKIQSKLARTIQLGKKITDYLLDLQQGGQAWEDRTYQNIMLTMVKDFPDLVSPSAVQEYQRVRTSVSASDPNRFDTLYDILNDYSPIPGDKVNWKKSVYSMNALDLQDLAYRYGNVDYISSKFPLIPYPTISDDDPDNLTSIYLQQASNLIQQNNLLKEATNELLRAIHGKSEFRQITFADSGLTIELLNSPYPKSTADPVKKPENFIELKQLANYFGVTDPTVQSYITQFNTLQSKTFNTDDDVEFFKDQRISKYNWSVGEKINKEISNFGETIAAYLQVIPVIGPAAGGLLISILSPIIALGYTFTGDGSAAVVMLDTFAKSFPGLSVTYSVSKILDKLVKKQPITDDDKELLTNSITDTASFMAAGVATGVASAVVSGTLRGQLRRTFKSDVLKASVLSSMKTALKLKLIDTITDSSQAVIEAEATKVLTANAIANDDSHTNEDNVFYWIREVGTGNDYYYYLFPDNPIPDKVQEMVDTKSLAESGRNIFILPPANIFTDAIANYTPKPGTEDTITFRKLAFQASEYFINERYRIQLSADAFFKKINAQYNPNEELDLEEFYDYVVNDYYNFETAMEVRKDGIDPENPNELKLPLVIPPSEFEFEIPSDNYRNNDIRRAFTKYLQQYVDQEKAFVDDIMNTLQNPVIRFIPQNPIESIKSYVFQRLFSKFPPSVAAGTTPDQIARLNAALIGYINDIYKTKTFLGWAPSKIAKFINEYKAQGEVLATIPIQYPFTYAPLPDQPSYDDIAKFKEDIINWIYDYLAWQLYLSAQFSKIVPRLDPAPTEPKFTFEPADRPEPEPEEEEPPEEEVEEEEEPPEEEVEEEPPEEEEEKLPNKTPQQIADYKMALFNSLRSVQTYLLAQQKVRDNEEISDLYDIILNSNSETSADITEAIIGLYAYQEKADNYYTIRHYVHPIMAILRELGDDSMDEMIQEEDQRQIEELAKQLKNYKYSNSKFNEFIKGDVSVLDVLKQFQDIADLVKAHPDITNDDLTEEESKISLNKKYVPFQPSIIQQKKKKKTKSLPRLG